MWNLFAYGEQIMRAADCKSWRKSPKGFFDKLKSPEDHLPGIFSSALVLVLILVLVLLILLVFALLILVLIAILIVIHNLFLPK